MVRAASWETVASFGAAVGTGCRKSQVEMPAMAQQQHPMRLMTPCIPCRMTWYAGGGHLMRTGGRQTRPGGSLHGLSPGPRTARPPRSAALTRALPRQPCLTSRGCSGAVERGRSLSCQRGQQGPAAPAEGRDARNPAPLVAVAAVVATAVTVRLITMRVLMWQAAAVLAVAGGRCGGMPGWVQARVVCPGCVCCTWRGVRR